MMASTTARLDSVAQAILARPLLIKTVQTTTIVGVGVLSGIAVSLYAWVVPIIRKGQSTRTKTDQFRHTVTLGGQVLQPFGKVLPLTFTLMALVCSRSKTPAVASRWKFWLGALAAMVPVAPYEIITVFPTNDRLFELDDQIKQEGKQNFGDQRDQEVETLLTKWRTWHTGRIIMPLVASSILVWGAVDLLPL